MYKRHKTADVICANTVLIQKVHNCTLAILTSTLQRVDTVDEIRWYSLTAYTMFCDSCSTPAAGMPHCSKEPSTTMK